MTLACTISTFRICVGVGVNIMQAYYYGMIPLAEIKIDLSRFCDLVCKYLYLANHVWQIDFGFAKLIMILATHCCKLI